MSTTTTTATPTAPTSSHVPLVMQLIIDGCASSTFSWPKGPWMAQSAHASIAAIQTSLTSRNTQEYISESNLHTMHKVVLQTPRQGKAKMNLDELSHKLTEARRMYEQSVDASQDGDVEDEFPKHFVWVEQPENVATCLAIAPNRKPAALKKILRACTLLKD